MRWKNLASFCLVFQFDRRVGHFAKIVSGERYLVEMTFLAVIAHLSLFATVFKTLPIVDVVARSARPRLIITGLYLLSTSQAAQLAIYNHTQLAAKPSNSKQSTAVESSCRVGPRAQGFSA